MAKLYYPSPDELQGATAHPSGLWYRDHQSLLVALLNTNEGRDLYCLERSPYPVVAAGPNYIIEDLSKDAGPGVRQATFRTAPKISNLTRSRWLHTKAGLDRMNLQALLSYPRFRLPNGLRVPSIKGGATLTVYPDPHPENTSFDGQLGRTGQGSTGWADYRTGAGTESNDTASTLALDIVDANPSAAWSSFYRIILLFDTSALGSGATITAAVLSFVVYTKDDDFTDSLAIVGTTPASSTAIANSDFGNFDTTAKATKAMSAITANDSTYNDFTFDSAGRATISKTSISKYGVRSEADRANSEPSPAQDEKTMIGARGADQSGTSKDPKLVITYVDAFVPQVIVV